MRAQLLEREAVIAAVRRGLARARDGHGGTLLIEGEAGLGKTSVLDAAMDEARIDVAFGRGEAMEGFLAFGMAARTFASLDATGLVGTGDEGGPALEPGAPYQRTLRWLEDRGPTPLLVALDDLQWADADSLSLFAFLARRLDRMPVLMVAALRPWPPEARETAQALVAGGHAAVHRVERLSPAAVRELLAQRTGADVNDETAHSAWAVCNGNPLLLEQVAIGLARGESLPQVAGSGTAALGGPLLLSRFAGMDEAALRCVQAGAVLGTTFRPELAAEVADVDAAEIDVSLEALFGGGLVVDVGGGEVRFVHPYFAGALYDDLAPVVRRRLHTRCFEVLASRGLDAEAAGHALRAELVGDGRAIRVLERAGRSAMAAGAVAAAERHLEAAVRFHGDRAPPALARAHAEAVAATGRMEEAADRCRTLLAEPDLDWPDRVEALRLMGRALYLTGAPDHGENALDEAVQVAIAHDDPARAVQPLLDKSLSAWLDGGPARALPIARRARDLARDAGPELRERANATWGHLALESGDTDGLAATDPVGRRLEGPGQRLDPAELAWPWAAVYQYAMNANYAGRYVDSESAFCRARDVVERAGAPNALATVQIHIANVKVRRGDVEGALREAERAQELAELTPGVLAYAQLIRAEVLAWGGRLEESQEQCRAVEELAASQWFARLWLAHVTGMCRLWQGDPSASDAFRVAEEVTREVGIREPCHVQWQGHAVGAHLAAGRLDDARRVVTWLEDCGAGLSCLWPQIALAVSRAHIAEHDGDDAAAERQFGVALDLHRQTQLPLHHVEALLAYGGFLRRRGRPAQARPHLSEAVRIAESCGAVRLARAASEDLALAGGKRRRGPEARDRLTSAEERVARLAAAGASNADIARRLQLSVHTIESHLKHVYAKLGLRSRRELMLRDNRQDH